ncbi:transporter [Oribacterium sp. C9]|uniref:QueT transporter family protein n=1 Tax=Oribacterium sp. C9 TaxID=1943579 RepID=UPI00098F5796|nr:QueT transporter family protein [Oribacterium sp. C9]OON86298.1 transporter [Oribacterium sp. C9]
MKNKGVLFIAQAGIIAALYVTLTYVFAAISFGEVQLRIAEALTILPMFTPAAIPGLFVGCIIGNAMGGAVLPDIICGSLATLAGAYGTWMLRSKSPMIACLPPIIANMIVVPFVLRYAYAVSLPIWFMALTVGAGEVLGCGILGCVLYFAVNKNRVAIFKPDMSENN